MKYADLLKDRRWQRKRLEVLNAAGWECQGCGDADSGNQLHVHHRRYVRGRKPWEYGVDELLALCERCHEIATERSRTLDGAVSALKLLGSAERIERAIGYLRTLCGLAEVELVTISTCEEARGAADAIGVSVETVLRRLDGHTFDAYELEAELVDFARATEGDG